MQMLRMSIRPFGVTEIQLVSMRSRPARSSSLELRHLLGEVRIEVEQIGDVDRFAGTARNGTSAPG